MRILNLLRKLLVERFGVTTICFRPEQTYASVVAWPHSASMQTSSLVPFGGPTPMGIDATHRRGPLFEVEKQWRRANWLCLYGGGLGHIVIHCPHHPWTRQVNQVSIIENSQSSSPLKFGPQSILVPAPQYKKFDVLSQLDDASKLGAIWLENPELLELVPSTGSIQSNRVGRVFAAQVQLNTSRCHRSLLLHS